jgi:DNA-binding winged helix-turn-helix (wHTH) protein
MREGCVVELSARAFDLLIALAARLGEVLEKRELLDQGIMIGEGSLRFHVAGLRKALGDGQDGARYVATSEPNTALREFPRNRSHQRGKGYRMVKIAQF